MKTFLASLMLAVTLVGCSAAQKNAEHVAVSDAEKICADAVALGVPDMALICAGIDITAPVLQTLIDLARKDPTAAKARYAAAVAAKK